MSDDRNVKKTISRKQAIADIRGVLARLSDEDHSFCEVASRYGIFCKGFSQWSLDELKQRYDWIARRRADMTREEMERLANAWQVARQEVLETDNACDTQELEHDTCRGWGEMDNAALTRFHDELCGEPVEVVDG